MQDPGTPNIVTAIHKQENSEHANYFQQLSSGDTIVNSREFLLVHFITCLVPFIRPTMPTLRTNDIKMQKEKEKSFNVKRNGTPGTREWKVKINAKQPPTKIM